MRIRYFDYPSDAAQILAYMPELYESNFPGFVADREFVARKRAQLREASRDPGQIVLVAEDAEGIWGFIWLMVEVEFSGRRRGEVAALHVATERRNQGIGRQLMAEGEVTLRNYGCEAVHLMVTAANDSAVHLYDSMGYQVTRFQMEKRIK